jgi:hypothetical protein
MALARMASRSPVSSPRCLPLARLDHLPQPRAGREWSLPGQQFVQHHAQGVDVGGDGHRAAVELLRRGVAGRGSAAAELGRAGVAAAVVDQLRDAEIQQLHFAGRGHQHVRRFEIAMHDQPRVRGLHRRGDLAQQRHAVADRQRAGLAIFGDRRALHVFQRQPGLFVSVFGFADTGVVETRDARIGQSGEDVALALEQLSLRPSQQVRMRQLQRDLAFVGAVGARRQPHRAHTAAAQRSQQPPRAEAHALDVGRSDFRAAAGAVQPVVAATLSGRQHRFQRRFELGVVLGQCIQPGQALSGVEFEIDIEQRREPGPVGWRAGQGLHAHSREWAPARTGCGERTGQSQARSRRASRRQASRALNSYRAIHR